ncbi:hypothetical protein IRJ41_002438 [Triplophysa rosa]|uniref:Uncharacterized protein n=1 Tax=Triplophysa rosa TaxID=992332 RepID=A0A9W7WTQ6_TRIRA|nr:hypothetical protein IRJ41_002438 [Triplophysa rosa]
MTGNSTRSALGETRLRLQTRRLAGSSPMFNLNCSLGCLGSRGLIGRTREDEKGEGGTREGERERERECSSTFTDATLPKSLFAEHHITSASDRALHAAAREETAAQCYRRGHQPMAANKRGGPARAQWWLIECDRGDMRHCATQTLLTNNHWSPQIVNGTIRHKRPQNVASRAMFETAIHRVPSKKPPFHSGWVN